MKPETILQTRICMFIDEEYPDTLYTASLAGVFLPPAIRSIIYQAGYRTGTPDLMILEPRKKFHGFFLEVKMENGRPSKEQIEFAQQLVTRGYCHNFGYGYDDSIKAIKNYFN
jgi:VRR-NUC domain